LTALPQATAGRRREACVLQQLLARKVSVARYIPRFLGESPVESATCFVMHAFPGVSVDGPVRCLDRLTARAMDFITAFHCETMSDAIATPSVYAELFGRLFDRARARNAPLADALLGLEQRLRARVSGARLPIVWLHGDFKIENLMFDERSRDLLGVVDWEHSEERGLPMLDPLYLIIYNRTLRGSIDVVSALDSLVRGGATPAEDNLLKRYCGAINIDSSMQAVLHAMFFVHHIGVRYRYALHCRDTQQRVRGMIDLLADSAARAPAVGLA
jgi:aminoglycoside phosphotransferase (APT) family kinase protein